MGSLNKAILIGRIGKDPEQKVTPSGKALCKFSLATSENWKDAKGEKHEQTEWHNIEAWGPKAKFCDYLHKGDMVGLEGKITYHEMQKPDGTKSYYTSIRVDNFIPLKSGGEGHKPNGNNPEAPAPSEPAGSSYDDDILPF
jgi:single-strand DNA-binding protein